MDGSGVGLLSARDLHKSYGSVQALRGASFDLAAGEVVALIGDNGAGKSTLVKCLSGVEYPDSGEILIDGTPVVLDSPQAARAHGIETTIGRQGVQQAVAEIEGRPVQRELQTDLVAITQADMDTKSAYFYRTEC